MADEGCLINPVYLAWQLGASTSVPHLWKRPVPCASEGGVRMYMAADTNPGPVAREDPHQSRSLTWGTAPT